MRKESVLAAHFYIQGTKRVEQSGNTGFDALGLSVRQAARGDNKSLSKGNLVPYLDPFGGPSMDNFFYPSLPTVFNLHHYYCNPL